MKKLSLYLLILSTFTLTGCIETMEEIWLNKDGSGKYSLTFDMSELFSNPMMKGMMEDAAKEEGLDAAGLDLGNMDTMAVLGDGAGGILDKVVLHMVMKDSTQKFFVNMTFPFDEIDEISEFYQVLGEGAGQQAGMNPMAGIGTSMLNPGGTFKLKGRTLTREPAPEIDSEAMEGEQAQMMKMFFATSTLTTTYHFPGKVKKSSIEGASVEGNTVTVEKSLLDLMEGKASMDGEIKFRKK
jgi:hypothetical protein